MQIINKKSLLFYFKTVLLLLLLLLARAVFAQDTDEYVPDDDPADEPVQHYFTEKPSGDSLVLFQRTIPSEKIKTLKKEDAFWYADKEFTDEEKPPMQKRLKNDYVPLAQRRWFQTVLWMVIIGGFAAALIGFLAGSQVGLFRKKNPKVKNADDGELITENIFAIDYQKEIDKAAQTGNYRLAIRLMYLRLLKNMTERNVIHYKQDKTNFDYLLQLQPTNYYNGFLRVTRNYEYAWYGLFEIKEDAYHFIKKDFEQFERFLG